MKINKYTISGFGSELHMVEWQNEKKKKNRKGNRNDKQGILCEIRKIERKKIERKKKGKQQQTIDQTIGPKSTTIFFSLILLNGWHCQKVHTR